MAAAMADKGHRVVGVDLNPAYVAAIQQGCAPVNETGLQEMIARNRDRLTATLDVEQAVLATEVTFIIVPTPSGPDGTFSMRHVLDAAERIGTALRRKRAWHLVVLSSTVMPGGTGGNLLPALEAHSGKQCGPDFGLCYNPEFIALGSVIHDILNPDMVLIGESDDRSGDILEVMYRGICESSPQINRMNFVNAELTKLSLNTFVTTKISYANMLAEVCETLPGADVDVVTAALGCDSRISVKYLKGALGYGGPCFPRDNVAFSALARANGVCALLAEATDATNRRQVPRVGEMVLARLPKAGRAGVLGLSYKPATDVIDESQGLQLARYLREAGVRVVVYDPAAMQNARKILGDTVDYAESAAACAKAADVLVIATPWEEFRELTPADVRQGASILDCWRVLRSTDFPHVREFLPVGFGPGETFSSVASVDNGSRGGGMARNERVAIR